MRTQAGTARAAALVALAVAAVLLMSGTASAAPGDWAQAEEQFVTEVNAERRAKGLNTLTLDLQLTRVARTWTAQMASKDKLSHNPSLASDVEGSWTRLGENVGYSQLTGASTSELVKRLHAAFVGSPGHYRNMIGDFTQVGVGVEVTSANKMWVTVVFQKGGERPAGVAALSEGVSTSRQLFAPAGASGRAASHVVLGRADVFADSLAGAALAGDAGPLLFTPGPTAVDPRPILHPRVRTEVDRVLDGSGTVYLLGGEQAVSNRVVSELREAGYSVKRLSGPDRIATAVAVAGEAIRVHGSTGEVLVATSRDWADAVAGGAYAAGHGSPVVLTGRDGLDPRVASFLRAQAPKRVWALGGTAALSDAVVRDAAATRVSGPDRSATSVAIAESIWGRGAAVDGGRFVAVHGHAASGWATALANAPRSAIDDAPQLLVADRVPASVSAYLSGFQTASVFGANGLDAGVLTSLQQLSGG